MQDGHLFSQSVVLGLGCRTRLPYLILLSPNPLSCMSNQRVQSGEQASFTRASEHILIYALFLARRTIGEIEEIDERNRTKDVKRT